LKDFSLAVYGDHDAGRVSYPKLWKYTLNLKTGAVTEKKISDLVGEFPVQHPDYIGKKTR